MKKFFNLIVSLLVGIGIGYLIELFISGFTGNYIVVSIDFMKIHGEFETKLIHTIIYAGFGLMIYLSSLLYNLEKLNLLYSTILSFSINALYLSLIGIYLKWFKLSEVIFVLLVFTIIYFILWTGIYFFEKRKIDKINQKLDKKID